MHITQEADYAVRIIFCLAKENKRMDARTISEQMGVTLRFALKILHKLTGAEVVKSFKGTHGGYELARPAEDINMRHIIEAVDGPPAVCKCITDSEGCNMGASGSCSFQKVFIDITEEINHKLESVSFAQLVQNA